MIRLSLVLLAGAAIAGLALPAAAAPRSRDVPVTQDLGTMREVDRALGIDLDKQAAGNPNETLTNPDGVVGFDGPPGGGMDDGVDYGSPMPEGDIGDIDDN